jgi:transposase, IS6 family
VRWYLRYPLSYQHVTELVAERGVEVDASCIWRWTQAYAPELNKRRRPASQAREQELSDR